MKKSLNYKVVDLVESYNFRINFILIGVQTKKVMIFLREIVPAATGNGGRNPPQYPRRGYFSSRRLNGGRSTAAPYRRFTWR
jgi:hypothetical protein